jgi:prepilin signal peptidase PulO-like enzyme (type II secretory pathway)
MELVVAVIAGVLMGHALDLAFPRFYTGEPLGGPLYRCRECKQPLRPAYAVPLLGWAIGLGKCRDCGETLPASAFVLPVSGGMLAAASYFALDESLAGGVLGGLFGAIFVTLTLTDLERRLLPNRIIYPSVLLAIALCWAWPNNSVTDILAGGLIGIATGAVLLLFSLPFGRGAFGMGDVKMIILIGFVVGMPSIFVAIFVGTISAAVVAMLLLVTGVRKRTDYMPHGPFLALGATVAMLWGESIWDGYTNG